MLSLRVALCPAIAIGALIALSGCGGPVAPGEAGGSAVDPVAVLTALPTPAGMVGGPARPADAAALQRAFTGTVDPDLAQKLVTRGLKTAAVRSWKGPRGEQLVTAISVWQSKMMATTLGGQVAEQLLAVPGSSAWTPSGLGGARGARVDGGHSERRLSFGEGPNSVYVRSVGEVDEGLVTKTARWLAEMTKSESE